MRETRILHEVRAVLAARGDVIIHRNNTGIDLSRGVKYGLGRGGADLVGVLTVHGIGVSLNVEVKAPGGRLSDDQKRQRDILTSRGAIYFVARSAEDAVYQIEQAARTISARMRGLSNA